ncbi:MAG: Rrf2 family transcriptional regulator [Candidatus Tectomicrobia bacterium]|uniref:Rrf2 family transcriptional regulator n=1 Tax=Tectimicrobiota bacterium TaxID=2528274 RepID=A0A932MKR1_UNCTE|nr:Rrf2 family transcriptional regulator [Candidatus Tectomicrobia bacterium]
MQISRAGDYALRAVIFLSRQTPGRLSTIGEIARAQQVPQAFLAKLMPMLIRKGMVASVQGPKGGYRLARPPREISFLDVIQAIEGPISLVACQEDGSCCDFEPFCTMNEVFAEAQRRLAEFFRTTTFADLPVEPCGALTDEGLKRGLAELLPEPQEKR